MLGGSETKTSALENYKDGSPLSEARTRRGNLRMEINNAGSKMLKVW